MIRPNYNIVKVQVENAAENGIESNPIVLDSIHVKMKKKNNNKREKRDWYTRTQGPSPLGGQGIRTTPIWCSPTPDWPTHLSLSVIRPDIREGRDGMAIITTTWIASGGGRVTGGGFGR